MLRTLKWVYNLGVKQERTRIAAYLEQVGHEARTEREQLDYMIRDNKELKAFKEKRMKQLEFNEAVNARIQVIISDMFQDNGQWRPGASIIFPEEESK